MNIPKCLFQMCSDNGWVQIPVYVLNLFFKLIQQVYNKPGETKTPRSFSRDLLLSHSPCLPYWAYAVDFLNLNAEISMSLCNPLSMF